jgi:hypothetical protein
LLIFFYVIFNFIFFYFNVKAQEEEGEKYYYFFEYEYAAKLLENGLKINEINNTIVDNNQRLLKLNIDKEINHHNY